MMIDRLIEILCSEKGEQAPLLQEHKKGDFFRALCNTRPPLPVSEEFLALQDEYLGKKVEDRGVVDVTTFEYTDSIALWQGDITRLNSDGIVNACNSALLGCFHPLHNCIDNVIHSNGGVQIRRDCHDIMQGGHLPGGEVVVTPAYNLPSSYIFHTVGPIVRSGHPTRGQELDFARCYQACVAKAHQMGLGALSFCCLSTGVYGYPKDQAARLAVQTVRKALEATTGLKVIFNVFLDEDKTIYEQELSR